MSLRRKVIVAAALAVGSWGVAFVAFVLMMRKPGEPLTAEALHAARRRWADRALRDYDMDVEVSGTQQGRHHIQVRAGRVVRMTTGGADVPEHIWPFWSVDGMFDFLQTELANAADPKRAFGIDDPSAVVLRVHFDPELGYPKHFLRHVLGRRMEIRWEVLSLRAAGSP